LLDTLEPVEFSGHYVLRLWGSITLCASDYEGEVENLSVEISSDGIRLEGDVTASWCGFNFGSAEPELEADGTVEYHQASDTVRVEFDSVSYTPRIDVFNTTVSLPVTINLSNMLEIPPIPFGETMVGFAVPGGTRYVFLRPFGVEVTMHAGYLRIESDMVLR